jgi:TolB-like protein/DNA-binding winged helix-turn-helix (wHTH) protein/tetratricopeptide (TPR) repeat protein
VSNVVKHHRQVPVVRNENGPIGRRNFARFRDAARPGGGGNPAGMCYARFRGAETRHLAEDRMDVQRRKLAVNGVIADFDSETLRTASGHSVDLRPQAFAVLRYLAEHAGRLVTKDELMEALWAGRIVTDDNLVQCVHEIRRAFQDTDRLVLKTAPRRGYRLVLPAAAAQERPWGGPERPADSDGETGAGAATAEGGGLGGRARVSIAVLSFVNMSSDREQEYFSDGITEDVITDLSRWQSIAVASRNATIRFKDQRVDIQAVGRELGVRFLVEGSVRRLGERVRITAQLIDAQTGHHVWAERYDRPIADLVALQDELVRTIAGTLVGRVYVSTAEHLRRRPPADPAAYDLTMRANWLAWDQSSTRAEAKRSLEQAIELDPGYGLPYSLLAMVLQREWSRALAGPPDILDRAFELAKRGIELSDGESASHAALGHLYLERSCFDAALSQMERAIEINPANPATKADLGIVLTRLGRAEEGLEHLRDARRIDPYFGPSWYWRVLGVAQFVLRRYAEALADFDRGAPAGACEIAMMAGCCAKLGLVERARELVAQCLAIQPDATIGYLVSRTHFKREGEREHLAECLRFAGLPE